MELQESNKYIKRVEDKSQPVEIAVRSIVERHTKELSDIIQSIKSMLKDDTDILTDQEIDDILLQLPILLFDVTDNQEVVGLQSDLSKQVYAEAYNEAFQLARGSVADKKSVAELSVIAQQIDNIIYDRAYKIIKQKIQMAQEVLNAVKKVQTSRQQRYDFGKFGGNKL